MRCIPLACLVWLLLLACCGSNSIAHGDLPAAAEKRDATADTVQQWLVGATDNATTPEINEACQFLTSLVNTTPAQVLRSDGRFLFWAVNMTEAQRGRALRQPCIGTVELDLKLLDTRAVSATSSPPKERRADGDTVPYDIQPLAAAELTAISQPRGVPDLNLFKNYVYDRNAGSKSCIYHVEYGVAFRRYPTEFPNVAPSILTPEARSKGMKGDDDNSDDFHSTCTADKALGQKFGVAKKATLVPVILADATMGELVAAFQEIAQDLKAHPDRQGFSVVSVSMTSDGHGGRQASLLSRAIESVWLLDVPVVVSAGNYGDQPGREEIDTYPALLASGVWPLIVAGSCNRRGERSAFSQVGHELTLYAVGEDVTCFEGQSAPTTDIDGTSFSAPLVAGQIAVLLSSDEVPIDTSNGNLVRNMRDYLKTNDAAGWTRSGDIRALWNGVAEAENPKFKVCTGVAGGKYVARETLRSAIQDDFCNADLSGPVLDRRYNENTMEAVVISLRHDDAGQATPDPSVLTKDSCVRYLLGDLVDGCDADDPAGANPAGFKAGGTATLGGVQYRVEPRAARQPAADATAGRGSGCDCTNAFLWNDLVAWGRGWASGDFGRAFRDKIEAHCHLRDARWRFDYGLGDDGREWTAWFRTDVSQSPCVSWVAKLVGANDDFTCHGC